MSFISIKIYEKRAQGEERFKEVDQTVEKAVPEGTEYVITRQRLFEGRPTSLDGDEGMYILLLLPEKSCGSQEIQGWIKKIATLGAHGDTMTFHGRAEKIAVHIKDQVVKMVFLGNLQDGTVKVTNGMDLEILHETLRRFSFKETKELALTVASNETWKIVEDGIEVLSTEWFGSRGILLDDWQPLSEEEYS